MKIIQVGDVHLASLAKKGRPIDEKDARFPADLRNLMAAPPVKTVFRALHAILEAEDTACLLFMGDFADRGSLPGFKSCATYLAEALEIGKGRRFEALSVGIVPGNHDIDRKLAAQPGLKKKFLPLQKVLFDLRLPTMPVELPAWLSVDRPPCRVDIALLNSCWGCGAKEYIPEEFRAEIVAAIENSIASGVDERAAEAYYDRQFDTPAFSIKAVQALIDHAAGLPGASLLVACAHHNILPQRMTRLAPYTELVNSGALRSSLLELGRPVIYLHGHIHEDPVEIVYTPGSHPLVCISAPAVSEGFNILELVFTPAGLPLSCYLQPWRFDDSSVFRKRDRQVIPIGGGRRNPAHPVMLAIYQKVVSERLCYWSALVAEATSAGAGAPADECEEALEMLVADQLLRIENYELGREHWIVGSKL